MRRWWRQFWCPHNNTTEEWAEVGRGMLTVTRERTSWECDDCGKRTSRKRIRS